MAIQVDFRSAARVRGGPAGHRSGATAVTDSLKPIEGADRNGPLALSFAQQRLWFITQLDAQAGTTYHLTGAARLMGRLDCEALRAALDRIVARHEVLRTRFEQPEGTPVQVIAATGSFALREWDLRTDAPAEGRSPEAATAAEERLQKLAASDARLRELMAAEANAPFDLATGPLIRGQLICLEENEHVLLVSMHHIVSDGWSLGIFLNELGVLYSAFQQGRPDPLPPLSVQYADYAHWQRQWVSGERLQNQLQYWKQQLAGAPPVLELPSDRARPTIGSYVGARVEVCLEASLARQLRELSRAHGLTLYMTMLGSWAVLLSRLSGQKDVVIGTPVANRNRVKLQGLIGFFVNTLALRIDLSADPSVSGLLEQVKGVVLQAHAHQDVPFEQVVDALSPVRSLAHGPLFQVMFAWQNTVPEELELPGLRLQGLALPGTTASFDLTLALLESGEEIRGALEYATALFERETVQRYLGCWMRLLQGMVAGGTTRDDAQGVGQLARGAGQPPQMAGQPAQESAPQPPQTVGQLSLLDEQERWQLLQGWNATAMPYASERCLQELFEAQAEQNPDAPAIVHRGERLSYGELNHRANRLAHYLRTLGVGPDTLVGICAERSLSLMVGVLAIVKAGGAYVPLDPAYPPERLGYMIGDSAPVAVLMNAAVRSVLESALQTSLQTPPQTMLQTPRLIDLEADAHAWAQQPEENPERGAVGLSSGHLAYIIYTSGSTGRPKGVMIEHRAAVNHMLWQCREYGFCATDRMLQHTSLSFDTAVSELWSCWTAGACLVLPVDAVVKDPVALLKLIDQEGVSLADFVPSVLQSLLSQPGKPQQALRILFCGGEALTAELVSRARTGWAEAVVNLYGPTEATIEATAWQCGEAGAACGGEVQAEWYGEAQVRRRGEALAGRCEEAPAARGGEAPMARSIPIGRPIANTRIYLLDEHLEPVPQGVRGEIYIAGDGLARGYLNQPTLTAQRFIPDPFDGARWSECEQRCDRERPGRMYRTGDMGRWVPGGVIEYLGRNDQQVKVRGYRIELGEIEARLREHPGVGEVVVIAREDTPGDKRLVAYYTLVDTAEVAAEELKARLSGSLPAYMVPAAYVPMATLPRMPNGKLDRQSLPAPDSTSFGRRAYEPPSGEVETALADIWRELLKIERVGRDDDFFDLGGHSLLATQLTSRLRRAFEVELPIMEVFRSPTLAKLAESIYAAQLKEFDPEEVQRLTADIDGLAEADLKVLLEPIGEADRSGPLALSFAQQRLWFITQLDAQASATYHLTGAARLIGQLNHEALRAALNRIVARHEVLRTRFEQREGMPVQVIAAMGGFDLREWELGADPRVAELQATDPQAEAPPQVFAASAEDRRWKVAVAEERLQELMAAEAHAPFDLATGPLIRGQLIRLEENEHVLLVSMHHIVSDGWSLGIFLNELGVLYSAFQQGRPDPLPPLGLQYADYAHWQRQWISGERLQNQLQYWKQQLAGAPPVLELPSDRARPAVESYAGARAEVCLEAALARQLRELSRVHGVTLYMTLLGSWAVLLSRLSGQKDVVIGTPAANRNRAELEGLIGFFVNTLALRIDLAADPSVSGLLDQVKDVVLQAHAHQDVPFEKVVDALSPVRSLAHSPLFQVMFAWQNTPPEELELPGLKLQGLTLPGTTASFDLTLALQESGEEIRGALGYATALFEQETVEHHLRCWKRLLQGMVAGGMVGDAPQGREKPAHRVAQLSLLDEQERWQLLHGWNATAMPYASGLCLQELFEAQAEQNPEAPAIVHVSERLSYGELNRRANRLAYHLRALGVGPNTLVGICAERSLELMVGVLAVVKVGGAYVPLDPAYPPERLAYMLEDCGAKLVVTQEKHRDQLSALASAGMQLLSLDSRTVETDVTGPQQEAEAAGQEPETAGQESRHLAGPHHLAYVIYTSGSTGRPKAAGVYQRGLNNLLQWFLQCIELSAADRVLVVTSPSFDLTQKNLLGPLLRGASVYLGAEPFEPEGIVATIRDDRITAMNLTPSAFEAIVQADPGDALSSLRHVMLGGEPINAVRIAQLQARYPHLQVINSYGPTECADVCAFHVLTEQDLRDQLIPIGKPVPHTRLYVLDDQRQPVPMRVTGEIYVGGVGVGSGYLNQPAMTAERFMTDPFDSEPQARMYRTGDVGRWLPGGVIEYLGRNDQQVKVRGYRIELGEIEARLREHPGVREVVVVVREDAPGDKRLVAYYTSADGTEVGAKVGGEVGTRAKGDEGSVIELGAGVGGEASAGPGATVGAEGLKRQLSGSLPSYMVPAAYVPMATLPRTPSGKLDRRALPAPEAEAYGPRAYEPPRGQIETAVAEIWRELLKIEQVGRDDDFFNLGGHSLLATQLTSRLRRAFEVDLPIMEVFRSPTLAQLAESIYATQLKEFDPEEVRRLSADIDGLTEADLQALLDQEATGAGVQAP